MDDASLAQLILEMETEKLNAQSDYKFAVVQIETKMKMEKANEIRRLKEENLKVIEDLSRAHYQQLLALEEESEKTKSKLNEQLSQQKVGPKRGGSLPRYCCPLDPFFLGCPEKV